LAVYRDEVRHVVDAAPAALPATTAAPGRAARMDGPSGVLRRVHGGPRGGVGRRRHTWRSGRRIVRLVIGAPSGLLRAQGIAGTTRIGVNPDDILLLPGCSWRIDPARRRAARAEGRVNLIMDGLRCGARNDVAGEPPRATMSTCGRNTRVALLRTCPCLRGQVRRPTAGAAAAVPGGRRRFRRSRGTRCRPGATEWISWSTRRAGMQERPSSVRW